MARFAQVLGRIITREGVFLPELQGTANVIYAREQ